MGTGSTDHGSYVISLSQTEMDGMRGAPLELLNVGWRWRWRGEATRIDRALGMSALDRPDDLRERVARKARRIAGMALRGIGARPSDVFDADKPAGRGFVVSDGQRDYAATVISISGSSEPLLMFLGTLPPQDCDLWVIESTLGQPHGDPAGLRSSASSGLVAGTRIAAPGGSRKVEELVAGDLVRTLDGDVREVLWVGRQSLSAADLRASPRLRPIRFRAGALADTVPDRDLLLSPLHRIAVASGATRALFNQDRILVAAADMVNGTSSTVDYHLTDVTYVHVLLENHAVLLANGVGCESFHPADMDLSALEPTQLAGLRYIWPAIVADPQSYGDHACRILTTPEAAILRHSMAA